MFKYHISGITPASVKDANEVSRNYLLVQINIIHGS